MPPSFVYALADSLLTTCNSISRSLGAEGPSSTGRLHEPLS